MYDLAVVGGGNLEPAQPREPRGALDDVHRVATQRVGRVLRLDCRLRRVDVSHHASELDLRLTRVEADGAGGADAVRKVGCGDQCLALGMQPVHRQSPPGRPRSTSTTRPPIDDATRDETRPATG